MATLAYTAAIQIRVANDLGLTYATTSGPNKTLIDNAWTVGAPGGAALDALTQIQQIGQWFSLTAAASVPSEWESWLVKKTALIVARVIHPERLEAFQRAHDDAEMAAIDAYTPTSLATGTEIPAEAYTLTMYNLLSYVIRHCARLKRWETVDGTARQRPRLWVGPEIIYAQTERVLKSLWNRANWPFRRRMVTLAIVPYTVTNATYALSSKTVTSTGNFSTTIQPGAPVRFISGTGVIACERIVVSASADAVTLNAVPTGVTTDLNTGDITCTVTNTIIDGLTLNETFAAVATREFCYGDIQGVGAKLRWSPDGTSMSARRARDAAGGSNSTGRPDAFRFENNATRINNVSVDVFSWTYSPPADGIYYAKGEVYVKGPSVTTLAAGTADMARFPEVFDHVIKDLVLSEVMRHYGVQDWRALSEKTEEEVQNLLPQFCDVGIQDDEQEVRDVYQDFQRPRVAWPSIGWNGSGNMGGGL